MNIEDVKVGMEVEVDRCLQGKWVRGKVVAYSKYTINVETVNDEPGKGFAYYPNELRPITKDKP